MCTKSMLVLTALILSSCQAAPDNSLIFAQETPKGAIQKQKAITAEIQQERNFRSIFAAHLKASGAQPEMIHKAMFLTPQPLLQGLSTLGQAQGQNFLDSVRDVYKKSYPEEWYAEGVKVAPSAMPIGGRSPVTFIVVPGFTSEFINADPFEEIIGNAQSSFAKIARPLLTNIKDSVYSVKENKNIEISLSQIVKVGSKDDAQGKSMVNVIMLSPRLGSLESLGTLDSSIEIYQRRLDKIFARLPGLGTVYLLGYSRGAIVGLELLRATHLMNSKSPWKYRWIKNIHGLVSLGGVLYGTELADHTFKDAKTIQSQTRLALENLVSGLKEGPPDMCATAFNPRFREIVAHNAKIYAQAMKSILAMSYDSSRGKIGLILLEERLRHTHYGRIYPGIFANLDQIQKLLFDLINMKAPVACYRDNVLAFKRIIAALIAGAETLTSEARLNWWRSHQLPKEFRILSIAATMPGAVKNEKLSPIIDLPYYGYQLPDYIFIQRPSYYMMLENDAPELNDSAVSTYSARYWPELDPVQGRQYDQLGVVATHHFGIGFHLAIADCRSLPNPFPRDVLVAALASYVRRYPRLL